MQTPFRRPALLLLALSPLALSAAPTQACSCSACSCVSEQEWGGLAGTLASSSGFHVDLRQDLVSQDQLRHGSHAASEANVNDALASGTLEEVERKTTTYTTTLGLDYAADDGWGVNAQVPWIARSHATIDGDTLAAGAFDESKSRAGGLGDVKVVGRFPMSYHQTNNGATTADIKLQFLLGLKLPTGQTSQNFSQGPLAGEALDRSLQLGTGSTDLILGLSHAGELAENWGWFTQATWQTALLTKDNYRPGDAVALNAGVRFTEFQTVTPQLQINARHAWHDRMGNADPSNTGSTSVLLSPGVSVAVAEQVKIYAAVQVPLWQEVRGIQLTSSWNASLGVSVGF